jgi:hypothetical protein
MTRLTRCARRRSRKSFQERFECPIVKTQGSAILTFLTAISLFLLPRGNEHNISTESAATKRSHQKREDETIGRWYRRYLGPDQLIHAHDQPAGRALISRQRGPIGRDEVACPASLCARIPRKHLDGRTVDWHGGRALPNPRWREDRTIRCPARDTMVLTSGGKPIPKSNGHSRLERRILIECRQKKGLQSGTNRFILVE